MGWWITLGIITLLAILPLGVRILYDAEGPLVKLVLGPVKLTVFPRPKKEAEPQKGKKQKPEPVEQIRGVDSAYSVAALMNKKLIEEAGRLNVPGRPIQYKTTPDFLRTFGLSSLEELPPIDKISFGEPIELPEETQAEET